MPPVALLALLLLAVLWGSAFPMIKLGLEGLSAPHLTLARHLVASACFVPFLVLTGRRLWPERRDLAYFLLIGTLGIGIYHLALNLGELRVSAGAASLIIATAPAITAIMAYLIVGDRMPALGWLGSAVSFLGVVLIVLGDGSGIGVNPFALLILLSAIVTSLFFVLQRPLFARYRPVEVTAFATWGGTVPLLLFLPGLAADVASAPAQALLATGYLGVFPSALAYTLLAFALSVAPVTQVTAFLYSIPVFSLLFSFLFLGEVPSELTLLGGAVAIAGIVIVNVAKSREARRPPAVARG